jgi:pimeloyl-ACP methyl ester carboxylesterase
VYGHSSGAGLVLHAAARGLPLDKIVLHEPPFGSGSEEERRAEQEEAEQISALLAQNRRVDAVTLYFASMGLPTEVVQHLAHDPAMLANAPTIRYDPYEVMSEHSRGGVTPAEQASRVTLPALVLAGGASPEWMIDASRQIADALPNGRLRVLEGHDHVVPPDVLAPVLAEFITG